MRKDSAGMVYLKSVDDEEVLLIMCGYADPYDRSDDETGGSSDESSRFTKDNNDKVNGWTNEIHLFHKMKGIQQLLGSTAILMNNMWPVRGCHLQ